LDYSQTIARWKQRVGQLKGETYALYLAYRDPRTPWYAKAFVALVVGYAFSPVDLIPDFIPVLGYLDDLVLVPLGMILARKMVPETVLAECRERAEELLGQDKPQSWVAAGVIGGLWILALALIATQVLRALKK